MRQAQHDGVPAGPLTGVRMLDRSRLVTGDMSMQGVAERLFRAIGRPELIDAPRFATNEARARHDDLLDPPIAGFVEGLTKEEALNHSARADVTVGPILDTADLVQHSCIAARDTLTSYPDLEAGALPMRHASPRLSGTPEAIHSPAPVLGEQTREVLLDAGFGDHEIEGMGRGGVL